ncbi:MAG: FHA domain-containing protein [Anaerolinea sp.]|nr:FHA domain-containing protein [Anaerolinea sp.]MCC6973240.1 FHA domain-containing protein [Anaerolineae bacterium]
MQGSGSFRLIVRRGPQPNQVYELNKDVVTLGRDITNDIVINDPEVSRHHCRLTRGGGGYTMEDLTSTNGTFINGQRLMGARPLSGGDQVGLGETVTLAYEASFGAQDFARAGAPAGAAPSPYQPAPAQPAQAQQPAPMAPPQPAYQTQQQPMAQQPYSPPPPPNYQQPYANYEPVGASPGLGRWFFIGCGCLIVLCVFVAVVGALYVDANDLYCQIPILRDVVGIIRRCP